MNVRRHPSVSVKTPFVRLALGAATAVISTAALMTTLDAQTPTGRSFSTLSAGYTQELFATTDVGTFPGNATIARVLGGVAFAPDGDVWASDCLFQDTRLHRFDTQLFRGATHGTTSLRQEIATVSTSGGCGLTNHPDGAMYSNSVQGVWKLDVNTGAPLAGPLGQPGNALGIAVDPVSQHIIYAGKDCHDQLLPGATTCTIWDLNPDDHTTVPFAMFHRVEVRFVDGIYFDPSGSYLFVTNRAEHEITTDAGEMELNNLTIVERPTAPVTMPSSDQIVRHLPMAVEPDGVAFHSVQHFVVTNDEASGTMTRFDFPGGDFSQEPSPYTEVQPIDGDGHPLGSPIRVYGSLFASGGHRGDLTQVGPDGCLYATQGRAFLATDFGTRYDDLTETVEDSIVRICSTTSGGFVPPPGVNPESQPSSIAGSTYLDSNGNHAIDASDAFIGGVSVSLSGGASSMATTTAGPVPAYTFSDLAAGAYAVDAPSTVNGYALSTSTAATRPVTLAAGEHVTGVDFLYEAGSLKGSVYLDVNDSGTIDAGDAFLSAVPVTLAGPQAGSSVSTSGPVPSYSFLMLPAGPYTVSVPAEFNGYRAVAASASRTLSAGVHVTGVDFLYVRGAISGFAYLDYNKNGGKDAGEPGLSGVSITLASGGSTTTGANGAYSFSGLAGGTHSVTAPETASGFTLGTDASLSASLPAGGAVPDLNFGYRDTVAPVCAVYGSANPPFMTYRDIGSGIVRLTVTKNLNTNFLVTIAPGPSAFTPSTVLNPSAMPTGTIATYATPTTSLITVTAQRIKTGVSAQLIVLAADAFGNTVTCDPVETTVTKLRQDRGIQTFTDLPSEEHFVTIENGSPGLRGMDIIVNGTEFRVRSLDDGEVRRVNVRRAMVPGLQNVITLVPRGRRGESADVTIAPRE